MAGKSHPGKSRGCMVSGDVPPPISLTPTSTSVSRYRYKPQKKLRHQVARRMNGLIPKGMFYQYMSSELYFGVVR